MDLMEGTATAVIKAPEDVKRKQCEILESCCGSDGIPSLEKVFGIHVILESGQEFTCSDVGCRRKTVEDLCDLVLRYDIVLVNCRIFWRIFCWINTISPYNAESAWVFHADSNIFRKNKENYTWIS